MPNAADIVAQIRVDSSKVRGDARKGLTEVQKLVRGFGTSSGTDPLINSIGRLGTGAAASLGAIKLLTVGLESFNTIHAAGSARTIGDIDAEVKAWEKLRDTLRSFPIVGELGLAIRESFTHEQEDIDRIKFEAKQQEKITERMEEKAKLQRNAVEDAKKVTRETEREIAALNKSPRQQGIMAATAALEDYRREIEKIKDATGKDFTAEQREALDALGRKVEALKKRMEPAQFSDAVSAAQDVQVAILRAATDGAAKRVEVAKKEAIDKKKLSRDEVREQARQREQLARDAIEQPGRANSPERQSFLRRKREEARDAGRIARAGTLTESGTRRMDLREFSALRERQERQRKELLAQQQTERSALAEPLRRDPGNATLGRVTRERMAAVQERQRIERQIQREQQEDERTQAEKRSALRRRNREPQRLEEEERRSRLDDSDRRKLREGLQRSLGLPVNPGDPRKGDAGDSDAALGKAAEKLDKAADKLAKAETVGVIRR